MLCSKDKNCIARSSNGRTTGSGPVNLGSSPSLAATHQPVHGRPRTKSCIVWYGTKSCIVWYGTNSEWFVMHRMLEVRDVLNSTSPQRNTLR